MAQGFSKLQIVVRNVRIQNSLKTAPNPKLNFSKKENVHAKYYYCKNILKSKNDGVVKLRINNWYWY